MPDKWEREIEELLRDKFNDDEPAPTPIRPTVRPRPRQRPSQPRPNGDLWRRLNALSPERLVVLGVVFALAAYAFRPFFGAVTLLLVLSSAVLIAGAVLVSVLRRESPRTEKRWRGQVIDTRSQPRPTSFTWYRLRANLRRWLSRLR